MDSKFEWAVVIAKSETVRNQASIQLCEYANHVDAFADAAAFLDALEIKDQSSMEIVVLSQADFSIVRSLRQIMHSSRQFFQIVCFEKAPITKDIVNFIFEGADDFLDWPFNSRDLRTCLSNLAKRRKRLAESRIREERALRRLKQLSKRELEIALLIASGCTSREVGDRLGISFRTVEAHRLRITKRLNAKNFGDITRLIFESGAYTFP